MARPIKTIVSLDDTQYYRVVRKAFLCGVDSSTGDNFEHRRAWVEKRMFLLADVFAMDICAYAVMSNHLHIVLRVDAEQAKRWSDKYVLIQWHKGFNGTLLTHSFVKDEALDEFELKTVLDSVVVYCERLTNISWFMRALNEPIARMAYVDHSLRINRPIRAKMAATPEASDYTGIQRRIKSALKGEKPKKQLPTVF